jgi:hypothetical protein
MVTRRVSAARHCASPPSREGRGEARASELGVDDVRNAIYKRGRAWYLSPFAAASAYHEPPAIPALAPSP